MSADLQMLNDLGVHDARSHKDLDDLVLSKPPPQRAFRINDEEDTASPTNTITSSALPSDSDVLRPVAGRGSFSTLSHPYGGGASLRRMLPPLLLRYGAPSDAESDGGDNPMHLEDVEEDVDESDRLPPHDHAPFSLALERVKRAGETSEIASSLAPGQQPALISSTEDQLPLHDLDALDPFDVRLGFRLLSAWDPRACCAKSTHSWEYGVDEEEHRHWPMPGGDETAGLEALPPASSMHQSSAHVHDRAPPSSREEGAAPPVAGGAAVTDDGVPHADEDLIALIWGLVGREKEERMKAEELAVEEMQDGGQDEAKIIDGG